MKSSENKHNTVSGCWIEQMGVNGITFRNCVFMADATMQGDKPGQTLWIKSASSTIFDKCTFKAAGAAAIKLGADSDADPDTGETTFADGLCSITEIRDSLVIGEILRENSDNPEESRHVQKHPVHDFCSCFRNHPSAVSCAAGKRRGRSEAAERGAVSGR
jgi:hypothetical protein